MRHEDSADRWVEAGSHRVQYFPHWHWGDYKISAALTQWLWQQVPDFSGYSARFKYCVFGQPLRGTLLPPRQVLYRPPKPPTTTMATPIASQSTALCDRSLATSTTTIANP